MKRLVVQSVSQLALYILCGNFHSGSQASPSCQIFGVSSLVTTDYCSGRGEPNSEEDQVGAGGVQQRVFRRPPGRRGQYFYCI